MTETPKKPPAIDLKAFARAGDWGVQRSMWIYQHKAHTLADVCRPGYFNDARDFGLKRGDIIDITLGDDPAEALYITAVFDNVYLPKGPVTIAIIRRDRATPCRVEVEEAA